jgi:hypothetical protein
MSGRKICLPSCPTIPENTKNKRKKLKGKGKNVLFLPFVLRTIP